MESKPHYFNIIGPTLIRTAARHFTVLTPSYKVTCDLENHINNKHKELSHKISHSEKCTESNKITWKQINSFEREGAVLY